MAAWSHGHGDMEMRHGDMQTGRHGDMETWNHGGMDMETWSQGDIDTWRLDTWRHGAGEAQTHGDMDTRRHLPVGHAISLVYSGPPVLRWAAIWDVTSLQAVL